MRARDLANTFPTVTLDTDVTEAARTLGSNRVPALLVINDDGRPFTILLGSQVLRLLVPQYVPQYVQDDSAPVGVLDEKGSDELSR